MCPVVAGLFLDARNKKISLANMVRVLKILSTKKVELLHNTILWERSFPHQLSFFLSKLKTLGALWYREMSTSVYSFEFSFINRIATDETLP